jgi:putative Holliday junction resolvase
MILANFKNFPHEGVILGIDWGARRTGLAVSDESQEFVFPREVIVGTNNIRLSQVCDFVRNENIKGIVIGLPLHADGTDSDTTRQVREFAEQVSMSTSVPVVFVEENLTSEEAKLRTANHEPRTMNLDSVAAAVILENALALIKRQNNV